MDNKKNHSLAEALAKADKKKVHTLPKQKEPKGHKLEAVSDNYWPPSLYLDQKDFPGIDKFVAGQTVNLAITCEVQSVNTDDNGKEKRYSANLKLTQISDITPRKGA